MEIKSVIIEDEPMGLKNLTALLELNHPEVNVIKTAGNLSEARDAFKIEDAELFFVDINLKDGSIFEVLNELSPENEKPVIFITAYEQYGAKAFNYPALHYLLKPINPDELKKAIERFTNLRKREQEDSSSEMVMQFDKILVPTQNGYIFLDAEQIIRIQSANKYSIVFTTDKNQHIVSRALNRFEALLTNKGFLRIHDSHLININYISEFIKGKTGEIKMSDNTIVPVASTKRSLLQTVFKNKV
jgi:two-component system LytT family response regulator